MRNLFFLLRIIVVTLTACYKNMHKKCPKNFLEKISICVDLLNLQIIAKMIATIAVFAVVTKMLRGTDLIVKKYSVVVKWDINLGLELLSCKGERTDISPTI